MPDRSIPLAGCAPAETPTPEAPSVDVSVALLMPGTISDGGWNGLAYQGLEQLTEEGFDTAYTENIPQADKGGDGLRVHLERLIEILSECDWEESIDGHYARWFYAAKAALQQAGEEER